MYLNLDLHSSIDEVVINSYSVEGIDVHTKENEYEYAITDLDHIKAFQKTHSAAIQTALDIDDLINNQIEDYYEDCRTEFLINQQELNEYYGEY